MYNDEAIDDLAATLNITDEEKIKELSAVLQGENAAPRAMAELLTAAGLTVVEVPMTALPSAPDVGPALEYGFKEAINAFLAGLGDDAPVGSLAEIIALNREDLANRAPYGQGYLETSQNTPITAEQYAAIEQENQSKAREDIDRLLEQYDLDVIASDVNQAYAPAGYPALTVPAGYADDGTPQGAVFVGGYLAEPQLLAVGHAFEQATRARVAPDLEKTLQQITAISTEENDMAGKQPEADAAKPAYVTGLEAAYGAPSQEGFGSAMFYEQLNRDDNLADAALAEYDHFIGDLSERWGEDAWMGSWKEVYARPAGVQTKCPCGCLLIGES